MVRMPTVENSPFLLTVVYRSGRRYPIQSALYLAKVTISSNPMNTIDRNCGGLGQAGWRANRGGSINGTAFYYFIVLGSFVIRTVMFEGK
jgi:hypothetical protein